MNDQLKNNDACSTDAGKVNPVTVRPLYQTRGTAEGVTLRILLPGVGKDDVELSVQDHVLTVTATRSDLAPADWTLRQAHNRPDAYQLKIRLHASLDPGKTTAKLADGVLQLEIAKHEEARPRKIEIS